MTLAAPLIASVGATLFTVRVNETLAEPPSSSLVVIVTVCVGALSVVLYDHVQLPALPVTVPIEAASVTVSAGTSPNVPLFVAVWPSLTVTDALLQRQRGVDVVDREVERDAARTTVLVRRGDRHSLRRGVVGRVVGPRPVAGMPVTVPIEADKVTVSAGTSPNVPLFVAVWPSLTVTDALFRVRVGATLFTVRLNVALVEPPSSSLAVIVTVCVGALSVALYDQLQLPAVPVTVPIEADRETVSAGTSPKVPLFVAVWPSLTVTEALLTVSVGATLLTVRLNVTLVEPPSSSAAVMVTVCVDALSVAYVRPAPIARPCQ